MKKVMMMIAVLMTMSSMAFAYGTLQGSWLDGASKKCKYSDGSVLTVGMSETCPISN